MRHSARRQARPFCFECDNIKLYQPNTSSWGTRLTELYETTQDIKIITYSLPNMRYIESLFKKRPCDISIICHTKFIHEAQHLKKVFPDILLAVNAKVHSKIVLVRPDVIFVSSENFGKSGWHETTIRLESEDAYSYYTHKIFWPLHKKSTKVLC